VALIEKPREGEVAYLLLIEAYTVGNTPWLVAYFSIKPLLRFLLAVGRRRRRRMRMMIGG
jgi:hypothetical protein